MSFSRSADQAGLGAGAAGARISFVHEEERRAAHSDRLASGTLACSRCDAPVAIAADGLSLAEELSCPFCRHQAPVRDFLSLRVPTRPARVVVRVRVRLRAAPAPRPA
jgi:hypothetical protein